MFLFLGKHTLKVEAKCAPFTFSDEEKTVARQKFGFVAVTPASVIGDSCGLIVESIHREGSLKPSTCAALCSETAACRRSGSIGAVHVCAPAER